MSVQEVSSDNFYRSQGKLLKKARNSAKLTQEEVAAHFSISQDVISKYERGKGSIPSHRILEFSRLYQKPLTYFFMTSDI